MKFKVDQQKLKECLNVIKGAKSLGRTDFENSSLIKIKALQNQKKVIFYSSNLGVWAVSILNDVELDESAEAYVEGSDLIAIVAQATEDSKINFVKEDNKIKITCTTDKKKKTVSSLLTSVPKYYDETPPKEPRNEIKVSANALHDAVFAVEFASSQDDRKQHLWGVQVEIYSAEDIVACASDKVRICWFDNNNPGRDQVKKVVFNPIKASFISAIRCLDLNKEVALRIGARYTVVAQDNQLHGIPNAVACGNGETLPDWRSISAKLNSTCKTTLVISRELICDFIKSASSLSCGKYGVKITANTNDKKLILSANDIGNTLLKTTYETEDEIVSFDGEVFDGSFTLTIDGFRDIVNKFKGDNVKIKIIDVHSPIQILDDESNVKFITSVLD